MIGLDSREAYCVSLVIANGGVIDYETLRDVILQYSESFRGLSERYLRYRSVRNTLSNLVQEKLLSETIDNIYVLSVDSDLLEYLIKRHAHYVAKAISNLTVLRRRQKQHVLEFDLSFAQETILSDEWGGLMPYELQEELNGAIDIHQKTQEHDAVITKCGRCVEIMIRELNEQYSLFPMDKPITRMISEIMDERTIEKFSSNREERETFRVFACAVYTIYRFRNKMGAHPDWRWGSEEVATSCLMLTLYIADLYATDIRKSFG